MTEDQTTTNTAAENERLRIALADAMQAPHTETVAELIERVRNLDAAFVKEVTEVGRLREELAGLKASAVVLPEDASAQLLGLDRSGDYFAREERVDTLLDSWTSASAVDGGGERTLAELRAALAAPARPSPTLAETRTGTDWCPRCQVEAGTSRYTQESSTVERCAVCGDGLVALLAPTGEPGEPR